MLAFEEINRLSREVLIKTKDIVQRLGYDLVYADTDSVFIKKTESIRDYDEVIDTLSKETGLSISVDYHSLEADEKIEVLKHYFGITYNNELVVRGIEIRRHDVPAFIKRFRTQLLYTLFDYKDSSEILTKGYENALLLVTQAIDTIITLEKARHLFRTEIENARRGEEKQDVSPQRYVGPNITAPALSERQKLEEIASTIGIDHRGTTDDELRALISEKMKGI